MGTIYKKAQDEKLEHQLDELLGMLEEMKGTSDEDNFETSGKQKLLSRLNEMIEDRKEEKRDRDRVSKEGWDFSKEKESPVFAEKGGLVLRPFTEADRGFYLSVRAPWRHLRLTGENAEYLYDSEWKSVNEKNSFHCVIINNGTPTGYLGLKDTRRTLWEIEIELSPDFLGKGIGSRAIPLFLQKVGEITGKHQFRALVEVDNIISQKCMEKIGADLIGTDDAGFGNTEVAARFEKENRDLITPHMERLADELEIEPEELLSHVLEYRIYA